MFHQKRYLEEYSNQKSFGTCLMEVISNWNHWENLVMKAKEAELPAVSLRETWEIAWMESSIYDGNTPGGRSVLAITDEGSESEDWKARFAVQGFHSKLKTTLVDN